MEAPITIVTRRKLPDKIFRALIRVSGASVLLIMLLVGGFLTQRASEALGRAGWSFFTTQIFEPESGRFGIAAVLPGTIIIALVAIVFALPLSVASALYISEYTSGRMRRTLISIVDLMAAVPSIVYGLWGAYLLQRYILVNGPQGEGLPRWLSTHLHIAQVRGDSRIEVTGPFGIKLGSTAKGEVPDLLPGAEVSVTSTVPGVAPLGQLNATVIVNPVSSEGLLPRRRSLHHSGLLHGPTPGSWWC